MRLSHQARLFFAGSPTQPPPKDEHIVDIYTRPVYERMQWPHFIDYFILRERSAQPSQTMDPPGDTFETAQAQNSAQPEILKGAVYQGQLSFRPISNLKEKRDQILTILPYLLNLEENGSLLGKGFRSKVYKVPIPGLCKSEEFGFYIPKIPDTSKHHLNPSKSFYAVKVCPKRQDHRRKPGSIPNEISIFEKLYSPPSLLKDLPYVSNLNPLLAVASDKKNDYLIMYFIDGKFIDRETNPLTPLYLGQIVGVIGDLDAEQLFHHDLHFRNMLVGNSGFTVFDFDWCDYGVKKIRRDSKKAFLPTFVTPSNLFVFESHALFGSYFFDNLRKWRAGEARDFPNEEMRELFIETLRQTSNIHGIRTNGYDEFCDLNEEKKRLARETGQEYKPQKEFCGGTLEQWKMDAHYGEALRQILKDPTPDVVDLEAVRVQVRFDDERDLFETRMYERGDKVHLRWRWYNWQHARIYVRETQEMARRIQADPERRNNPFWNIYADYHQKLSKHYLELGTKKLWEAACDIGKKNRLTGRELHPDKLTTLGELERLLKLDDRKAIPPLYDPENYDIARMIQQAGENARYDY